MRPLHAFSNGGKVDWQKVGADAFGNAIGNSIVGAAKYSAEEERSKQQQAALNDLNRRNAADPGDLEYDDWGTPPPTSNAPTSDNGYRNFTSRDPVTGEYIDQNGKAAPTLYADGSKYTGSVTDAPPNAPRLGDPKSLGYSPEKSGWHDYVETNLVCPAEFKCSPQEIADQLARYGVPGQDPTKPVESLNIYDVYDPRTGVYAGKVLTEISDDGLTIKNTTRPLHVFYDGQIVRSAYQTESGDWYVTTRGYGNNVVPGFGALNQWQGPKIFRTLDEQMRINIEQHHGK